MALKYITFFALLAMATACDLKRSHAFPTRVFENYNNGQFEDVSCGEKSCAKIARALRGKKLKYFFLLPKKFRFFFFF